MTLPPNPHEDRPRDLQPPSGPPAIFPPPSGSPDLPPPPTPPYGAPPAGTNGFAIAALVCGLAFFVPFASILAIVFGIIALRQIAKTFQRGRGMAIAGIVAGSLVVLAWVALFAFFVSSAPSVMEEAPRATSESAFVEDLRPGDCFSGLREDVTDEVTLFSCTEPHQAQVIVTPTLDGDFPGAEEAVELAGERCEGDVEPLVRDEVTEVLDLYLFAPESSLDWRLDRSVQCVLAAVDGEMTGSLLK